MSKAFTREDASDTPILVPQRAPLPPDTPNYVTRRGLACLRAEREGLLAERARRLAPAEHDDARAALSARLEQLEARIASAEVVEPAAQPHDEVRFGASVSLRGDDDAIRAYRIVGVDEANAEAGRVAFTAPLSRALLGKRVGDDVTVRSPRGSETLELVGISYEEES